MTGIERIRKVFESDKKIKLMTHVVGGYPDIDVCESLITMMAQKDVDLIEVQLPFSDPIADGPVIVHANHQALRAGIRTDSVLTMIERVRKKIETPLLIMSYINPLFSYGIENIIKKAVDIGVDGFIVPDCPLEETELNFPELCKKNGLAMVPLIAPSSDEKRMMQLVHNNASPFVYAVLRLGITGRKSEFDDETISYLKTIRESTDKYIAGGFGICEKAQLELLSSHADCGVIGSALLKTVTSAVEEERDPVDAADTFLNSLV